MGILVRKDGFLTTVQDRGIIGYMHQGIGVSGAADQRAYRTANYLVDNFENEAALEITMIGPVIEFTQNNVIAVTGGNLMPQINDSHLPMYRAVAVCSGDVLSFGSLRTGCRAYIAFAGGLDVPVLFGSRSTYLRCSFGGVEGRKLQEGDAIDFSDPKTSLSNMRDRFIEAEDYSSKEIVLRVVMGPQDDLITEDGIRKFLDTPYTVTREMDRVGVRLSGEKIDAIGDGTIVSDGLSAGAIQVPPNGQPIVMLSDCATTGGYNKIATVISADVPLIAQAMRGVKIRFQSITIDEAQDIYIQQLNMLSQNDMVRRSKSIMKNEWTVSDVKELMAAMGDNNIGGIRIDGSKLEIDRIAGAEKPDFAPIQDVGEPTRKEGEKESELDSAEQRFVYSPIIGTFYAAPAPDKPPFVTVGSKVSKGDVLCIVESMKMMNDVISEQNGIISEIMVRNEQDVEYGQPLFRLE